MNLSVRTTYREFENYFLGAIENSSLIEYRDKLRELAYAYPRHYNAWLFLAKTYELLNEVENASETYKNVLQLLDPTKMGARVLQLKKDILNFCTKFNQPSLAEYTNNKFDSIKPYEEAFVKSTPLHKESLINQTKIKSFAKNEDKAQSLIKEANKLFSIKKFEKALDKILEAEKLKREPSAQLYISMANIALALNDLEKSNKLVIDAVSKGFAIANQNDKYALGTAIAAVYRRTSQWLELESTNRMLFECANTIQRKIISLLGVIEVNLKLGHNQIAKEWIDELLILDPSNKIARSFLSRLKIAEDGTLISTEEIEEINEEFRVEIIQQQKFALSPMLRKDIEHHKYTDPAIIKKGNIPNLEDAKRLLSEADKEIEESIEKRSELYVYYPQYLQASKAFSDLQSSQIPEELFQKCLSRYSSLKATELFAEFSKIILSRDAIDSIETLQQIHDCAKSYYLESLRLTLDTNIKIAEKNVDNFIKITAILSRIKNGDIIEAKYFNESFPTTSRNCLKNKLLTHGFCESLLNIGSVNSQNFNNIFGKNWLDSLFGRYETAKYVRYILDEIRIILNLEMKEQTSVRAALRMFFEERKKQFDLLSYKFNQLSLIEFHPTYLQNLIDEWKDFPITSGAFYETDRKMYVKCTEIIERFKPYLERREAEKSAIVTHLSEELKEIRDSLRKMPTYWGRIGFEPLINNWLDSLQRLITRRYEAIQPKIKVVADPPVVSLLNKQGSINLLLKNIGAAATEKINIFFQFQNADEKYFEKNHVKETIIHAGDIDSLVLELTEDELIKLGDPFEILIRTTTNFRDQKLSFQDKLTVTKQGFKPFLQNDIPWNETVQVKKELFKGRDDLIEKLASHYLSNNRFETFILYGLTRHGKSSIHRFLSEKLKLKIVETDEGEKRYLPFAWSFAKAAGCGNARDMWNYLIRECILDKLEEYINNKEIPERIMYKPELAKFINRQQDFRSTHFSRILKSLNEEGYLSFISIDEFTFYTEMIDKGMVNPSFLQQIREITIDEKTACFIFAGIYDLIEILKEPKYGITSQLANCIQYQVGPIDKNSSEELIQIIHNKLRFTEEARKYIQFSSNNIPHFIQMICRRCGWYAVETQRNIIGLPEAELIISTLAGENKEELPGGVKPLEGQFRDTQYRPQEIFNNAVISTIAIKSKGMKTPRGVSREEMIQTWGAHRTDKQNKATPLGNFQGKLANAIEALTRRGVLIIEDTEDIQMYRIGVDLFRRWWAVQFPNLESELDKLIGN
ncbi:MAG: tetratricopeptide repeat protein [Ignavibacteriaceae bacterium]